MSAMLFREIGNSELNSTTWMSLLHALLIQIVLHLISFLYALAYHPDDTIAVKFIKNAISICQTDFLYYAIPISQVLFGTSITVHAALACFLQYILIVPIHQILGLCYIKDCEKKMNTSHEPEAPVVPVEPKETPEHNNEEEELPDADSAEEVEVVDENGNVHIVRVHDDDDLEEEQSIHSSADESCEYDHEEPIVEVEKKENKEPKQKKEEEPKVVVENDNQKMQTPPDVPSAQQPADEPKPKYWSKKWLILWAFVNQLTICSILGIIWSALPISMPKFLDNLVTDLEKAIYASGLFCVGVVIWNHSFKGAPVLDVIVGVICHFLIEPALSLGFSYLLKQPKDVAKLLVFANAAPSAIYGYHLSINFEFDESMVSYVLYWTSLLTLPVNLIWTGIINGSHAFN